MKRYFYTSYNNRGDVEGTIYKLTNNDLAYVCGYNYSTASCRGSIHEVFNALMDCGEIPKKYYTSSVDDHTGSGYFYGIVRDKYNIKEI